MNKKVFRLFIALFLIVVFTNRVNAGIDCNPDDQDVTITETGITDAGFDVALPVCKWLRTGKFRVVGGAHDSYQSAFDSGMELELIQVESLDGKDCYSQGVQYW